MNTFFDVLAGAVCGVLSGFGIGGGSLLLLYMAQIAGIDQMRSQGINLIYFIPSSAAALISHIKNKLVSFKTLVWTVPPAIIMSILGSLAATSIPSVLLRKFFGIFLTITGVKILLSRRGYSTNKHRLVNGKK